MKNYKFYEVTTCRLAIRVCIGYGPSGRKKHRTFSMNGINPNASWEAIMEIIYALAPLLEFPVVDVQKVTTRKIIFYEDSALVTPAAALAAPVAAEFTTEFFPVDSLELEIAVWEREAQTKFALALVYMLWIWNLYCAVWHGESAAGV